MDDILTLKAIRRKNELIWRETRTTINVDIYYDRCKAVKRQFLKENRNSWNKGSLILKVTGKNCFLSYILHLVVKRIQCFSSGVFPTSCKLSIIFPLIKKPGLDPEILKNYRHVTNLSFISKISEKAIANQIHVHLKNNDIVDYFQTAYKAGHSYETALLGVYNDIVTTIGRSNGDMLVLLDLSAAFDTIDHDNLFCILGKYVGICGNALKLIKSYFYNRTQRVPIDDVLSDFANIICGVPQGSVLETKFFVGTYCQ